MFFTLPITACHHLRVEYGTFGLFKVLYGNRHITSEHFAVNYLGKVVKYRPIDIFDRGPNTDASHQWAYETVLSLHFSFCGRLK